MLIQYEVPKHIEEYLNCIPEDMVSEFITKAIEKAIEDRTVEPRGQTTPPEDYSELLSKISELLEKKNVNVPKLEAPPKYNFEVVTEASDDVTSEDDDFLSDFLSDIIK